MKKAQVIIRIWCASRPVLGQISRKLNPAYRNQISIREYIVSIIKILTHGTENCTCDNREADEMG